MASTLTRKANGQWLPLFGPDESRPCRECGEEKPPDQFHVKVYRKDGSIQRRSTLCKSCHNARYRKSYDRKPRSRKREPSAETQRKKRAKYREDMADPTAVERKRRQAREAARRRRERAKVDPEVAQALADAKRRWEQKVYADPERHATFLQDIRMRNRIRNGSTVALATAIGAYRDGRDLVPAQPFLDWIDDAFPRETPEAIETMIGLNPKTLRNLQEGQPTVSLSVIDVALTVGLGRPDLVMVLYPVE